MNIPIKTGIPADQATCVGCKATDPIHDGGRQCSAKLKKSDYAENFYEIPRPVACMAAARKQAALEKLGDVVERFEVGTTYSMSKKNIALRTEFFDAAKNYRAACAKGDGDANC